MEESVQNQPDFVEGMDLAAVELSNGEVQWRGNPINPQASAIYARVLEEHLPKFKVEE